MKKLRNLLATAIFTLACALGAAQDDMLVNLQLQINQATSPVVVTDLATGIIITGRHNQTGFQMAKFTSGISAPVLINTSAIMKPRFALRESNQRILLAGTMITGGQARVFAARIDHSQQTLDWLTEIPGAVAPVSAAQSGQFLYVGVSTSNGTSIRPVDVATGALGPIRSTNSSLRELALLSEFGELYFAMPATNFLGGTTDVARLAPDGSSVWFQSLPHAISPVAIGLSGGNVHIAGMERPDSQTTVFRAFFLSQQFGGSTTDSATLTIPFATTRPVAFVRGDKILLHFSEQLGQGGGPRHQAVFDMATNAWSTEPLAGFGADVAVAERDKVPVFLTRETSGELLAQIRATQHWAPVTHQVGHEPRSLAFDREGRLTVASENIGNNSVRTARFVRKPIAVTDKFDMFNESPILRINSTGILANDLASEGAEITIEAPPGRGTVQLLGDGAFEYVPNSVTMADDFFFYRLSKGTLTTVARVDIRKQPTPIALDLVPGTSVKGGTPVDAKLVFTGPRLRNDLFIDLDEDSTATALSVDRVAQRVGQSASDTFRIVTARVAVPTVVTIRAFDAGFGDQPFIRTVQLTIDPPVITNLEALSPTIIGGAPGQFRITLDSPAPAAGLLVSLTDNSTAIAVPTAVRVPAGQTSALFSAPTATVSSSRTATVTALSNNISRSVTVAIVGVAFAIEPLSVTGGDPATGTVTLTSNVIGTPVLFGIADDSPATAPQAPTVTILVGQRIRSFGIITAPVTSTRSSTFVVTHQNVTRSVTMTVRAPALQAVAMNPPQVRGGQSSTGTVTLTGRAPAGGIVVTLQAGAGIVQVPASVTVAQGQSTVNFTATTSPVSQTFMVTIAARHNSITRTTTLILTP
ncbi:MAG: hypothetical protein IT363_04590 [Methanoregulaceae archaeon]|nr:hypothetical protein [Methanoregulaceae archaeon]